MLRSTTLLIVILAALAVANGRPAAAQRWDNPNYYYHSSTVAESRDRGMADLVRSAGQAAYDTSEAAKNLTQARSQQIDNDYKWTQTYFAMREENRRARAAERLPRPTEEQLIRYAQADKPKLLDSSQLNPMTGQIAWPRALRRETFEHDRNLLEPIFARRAASDGVVSDEDYDKAQEIVANMQVQLKQDIDKIAPSDYVVAKNFLNSLGYEAKL